MPTPTLTFQTSAFDSAANPIIHAKFAEWLPSGGYSSFAIAGGEDTLDMIPDLTVAKMFENIEKLGNKTVETFKDESITPSGESVYFSTYILIHPDFIVSLQYRDRSLMGDGVGPYYTPYVAYSNRFDISKVKEYLLSCFCKGKETPTKGYVYMLMSVGQEYQFKVLPKQIDSHLEEGNYSAGVLTGYRKVLNDLGATTPAGRISIFDGPPGTGKTYLVRGMLTDCDKVAFVFVAPEQLIQMTGPSFLGQLIDFSKRVGKPVAFIVEDADQIIATRDAGNMSYVANILNLGDGILGQMLDLRLIFTTNAKGTDLDPAIVRPGRLSAHIHVGKLETDQCNEIYKRLTGDSGDFTSKATLAEVYQQAMNIGWTPSPSVKPTHRIGFTNDD